MKKDIYVLAHEVKNPLCVVKGYLEMLNQSNLERYKKIIQDELMEGMEILDNYMNYNKISIQKEEIDLNLMLLDIKDSMEEYLKRKGIYLKIHLIDDEIYLKADYQKLRQVFYNLIKNSIEAQCKKIIIKYQVLYDSIAIYIKNDGSKILDFDRLGNNYTSREDGHGIGVMISKKIIAMHEGTMNYFNEKNGVCCNITLPI